MNRLLGASALAWASVVSLGCDERPTRPLRAEDPPQVPAPAEASVRTEPSVSPEPSRAKASFLPGELPVAPFVAEELAKAPANVATLVYVGATWCEPCQRFHRALEAGALDAEVTNLRLIEYDHDASREALLAAGYRSKLIPLFALPKSDGSASGKQIEGSIKGEGAVRDILPRLLELTGRSGPVRR